MPNFEEDLPVKILINDELKKYTDEDMLWLYDEVNLFKEELDLDLKIIRVKFSDFMEPGYIKNYTFDLLNTFDNKEFLSDLFEKIKNRKKIHEEEFSYLKQDKRFCLLLGNFILNKNTDSIPYRYNNNPYPYIIFKIFYKNNIRFEHKSVYRKYKNEILKEFNNSKNFDDIYFLEWAYSYLKNKNEDFKEIIYTPKNKNDHKNLIISFLDHLLYIDKNQHYFLTSKLFKAWNQKKFRDSHKVKNMYHLPLTKNAKDELKKLSQVRGCSENLMLEKLINEAYLKEICDENGVSKY